MDQVVNTGHPSANNPSATRNVRAESGVGTARRQEVNMLPIKAARITRGGMTVRKWGERAHVEEKKGVLPRDGNSSATVMVRSGNNDAAAIGLQSAMWGLAAEQPAPAPAASAVPWLALGLLGVAGVLLLKS